MLEIEERVVIKADLLPATVGADIVNNNNNNNTTTTLWLRNTRGVICVITLRE